MVRICKIVKCGNVSSSCVSIRQCLVADIRSTFLNTSDYHRRAVDASRTCGSPHWPLRIHTRQAHFCTINRRCTRWQRSCLGLGQMWRTRSRCLVRTRRSWRCLRTRRLSVGSCWSHLPRRTYCTLPRTTSTSPAVVRQTSAYSWRPSWDGESARYPARSCRPDCRTQCETRSTIDRRNSSRQRAAVSVQAGECCSLQ